MIHIEIENHNTGVRGICTANGWTEASSILKRHGFTPLFKLSPCTLWGKTNKDGHEISAMETDLPRYKGIDDALNYAESQGTI